MKKIKEMTLPELLIAWDESQRRLEEIKKPEYIKKRVKEVFGDKKFTRVTDEEIKKLLDKCMEV